MFDFVKKILSLTKYLYNNNLLSNSLLKIFLLYYESTFTKIFENILKEQNLHSLIYFERILKNCHATMYVVKVQ